MTDEYKENTDQLAHERPDAEETLTFRVKRAHFYAVLVPLFFLLGLASGYLLWGQTPPAPLSNAPLVGAADEGAASQPERSLADEVAEQIPTLTRHDISIDEQDPGFGPEDALVTIVEFADFECPYCQRHFFQVLPELEAAYAGQVRYVYKDFPLTSIHPNALPAALAAQCAHEQDAFWPFHDLLYEDNQSLSRESYEGYAAQLDLDTVEFAACLDEERYLDGVEADVAEAASIGLSSTPTFFINGLAVVGAQPFEVFAAIIDYELANTEGPAN